MLKILANLKDSWISVLILIVLLSMQAWADLELPKYTSKIVNVGIEQGGIENTNPDVIKKVEDMRNMPNINESMIEQMAISAVKEEYKANGIDINKMQNEYILKSGIQMLGVH